MKRFAICALSVMVMAGAASAQDATVWIQPVSGGNHVVIGDGVSPGVSQTAIVQVWLTVHAIPYSGLLDSIQVPLSADATTAGVPLDAGSIGPGLAHFDVAGFNDQGPYGGSGNFTRQADPNRGFVANPPAPGEALELYQVQFVDITTPWTAGSGVGPGTYLLDEIIIHGVSNTTATPGGDVTTADTILVPGGSQVPTGLKIYPQYDSFAYYGATIAITTGGRPKGGNAPLFVSVVAPEPASLSLLILGGLAAFRRRR